MTTVAMRMIKYPKPETIRVVVHMRPDLVKRVDAWGAGKGKANRTEAVRDLLEEGLEADRNERA